jgi:hypothetical protein
MFHLALSFQAGVFACKGNLLVDCVGFDLYRLICYFITSTAHFTAKVHSP